MEVFRSGVGGPVWMLQLANQHPLASQMLGSTDILTFSPLNETQRQDLILETFHENIAIIKAGECAG